MLTVLQQRILIFLLLLVLYIVVVSIKIGSASQLPYFDPTDDICFHWTESAFHFRHTQMIANGGTIPSTDQQIQYPEGLDTYRHITPLMDHVYGQLHRWFFPSLPLHVFLIYAIAFYSTLSVFACFLAGQAISNSSWLGLACASLYGLAPGSWVRSGGTFLREDFALPLLFGSFTCLLLCIQKERRAIALIGGLLLTSAFASWHVSQFFFLLLIGGLALLVFLFKLQDLPRCTITIYTSSALLTSLLLPALRAKYYYLSIPILISIAIVLMLWVSPRLTRWSKSQRSISAAGLLLLCGLLGFLAQQFTGAHSHVFAVLWAKIRYLGQLPLDPLALPFEAKAMWTSSFVSPPFPHFFGLLSSTLLFGGIGVLPLLRRCWMRTLNPQLVMVLYLSLTTLILFVMFERLAVFAVFMMSLLAAPAWMNRSRWFNAIYAMFLATRILFGFSLTGQIRLQPSRPPQQDLRDLVQYLRQNTKTTDVVICPFPLGSVIATYADRPVLLHSKFESKKLREKVKESYTAMFDKEALLYEFCTTHGVQYLIHDKSFALRFGPRSPRYNVGHSGLPTNSATFQFNFEPSQLQYFQLVHQNSKYRIFKVGSGGIDPSFTKPFNPYFDLRYFIDGDSGPIISDEQIRKSLDKIHTFDQHARRGQMLARSRKYNDAVNEFHKALAIYSQVTLLWNALAEVHGRIGEYDDAIKAIKNSLTIDPDQPQLRTFLNQLRQEKINDHGDQKNQIAF